MSLYKDVIEVLIFSCYRQERIVQFGVKGWYTVGCYVTNNCKRGDEPLHPLNPPHPFSSKATFVSNLMCCFKTGGALFKETHHTQGKASRQRFVLWPVLGIEVGLKLSGSPTKSSLFFMCTLEIVGGTLARGQPRLISLRMFDVRLLCCSKYDSQIRVFYASVSSSILFYLRSDLYDFFLKGCRTNRSPQRSTDTRWEPDDQKQYSKNVSGVG